MSVFVESEIPYALSRIDVSLTRVVTLNANVSTIQIMYFDFKLASLVFTKLANTTPYASSILENLKTLVLHQMQRYMFYTLFESRKVTCP